MTNQNLSKWITSTPSLLPDFIIGGAMKSGTSTLHTILDEHPKVFIPQGEIHFFDFDNLFQHSAFNFFDKKRKEWLYKSITKSPEKLWKEYLSNFRGKEKYIKGEDSTTYLASRMAAERISIQKKKVKLIFLLRHPTKRAYSQYHHMLRSGRAVYSFEDTISYNPESILQRSLYKEQLEYYFSLIPRDRIKIILFEDLVSSTKNTIERICKFLGLDFQKFDQQVFQTHSNKAKLPKNIRLQILYNRFFRKIGNLRHLNSLPNAPSDWEKRKALFLKMLKKAHRFFNPLTKRDKPTINKSTRNFLDSFFLKRLNGIDELTGKNILSTWFPNKF